MFHDWPAYQTAILSVLILLCMGFMVWAVRVSAGGRFRFRRFIAGLLVGISGLALWTYTLIQYPNQTRTITGIVFTAGYVGFMGFVVLKFLKSKNQKNEN